MSLRERLVCLVDFVGIIFLCLPPLPNCFLRVSFPTFFAAVLKDYIPLVIYPISGAANSSMSFCRWDHISTQKGNCCSPKILCESPKSTSPRSSNPSIVWKFYLSWNNHRVLSYVLEMNVGHLSEHQNKPSDTERYKGHFFTRCVSQIHVYSMKKFFDQRSKLQVTECLIVHVLSSCYNVSSL